MKPAVNPFLRTYWQKADRSRSGSAELRCNSAACSSSQYRALGRATFAPIQIFQIEHTVTYHPCIPTSGAGCIGRMALTLSCSLAMAAIWCAAETGSDSADSSSMLTPFRCTSHRMRTLNKFQRCLDGGVHFTRITMTHVLHAPC